jgi:hypothetical protein
VNTRASKDEETPSQLNAMYPSEGGAETATAIGYSPKRQGSQPFVDSQTHMTRGALSSEVEADHSQRFTSDHYQTHHQ